MKIQPNNWNELQHYKDRSPIWIKLHRKLLDNYEYFCLPIASRAIAPLLWLLSSEYEQGMIEAPEEKIAFRLRMTAAELVEAVKPLVHYGFFSVYQDDSDLLAEPEQLACLEKRREETEEEIETEIEEENIIAPSRKNGSAPKVDFDYSTGRFINISAIMIDLWQQGFPAVNVEQEIIKAGAWAMANPKNRKSNWPKFLTNWLSRSQDSAGRVRMGSGNIASPAAAGALERAAELRRKREEREAREQ